MKKNKKVLVDMSCVLIHHGHIRLLKKAAKYGKVFVALTSDNEIKRIKKITPELSYSKRKEIIASIKYVSGVIKSKYYITNKFLKRNKFDFLIHGSDGLKNQTFVEKKNIKIFSRTSNISTSILRRKAAKNFKKIK